MAAKTNKNTESDEKQQFSLIRRVWITLATIIVLFTSYVIVRNLIVFIDYRMRIHSLEKEKRTYLESIAADSALIERLKYDEYLEQYARERYRMQRPGEQVFIVE